MRASVRNAAGRSDEVLFLFDNNSGYTANFDAANDVSKLGGASLSIASFSADGIQLTGDFRPMPSTRDSIRLNVAASASGAYTLSFTNLPASADWYLKDNKLNTLTNLTQSSTYAFNILTSDSTTFGRKRFEIVLVPNVTSLNTLVGGKNLSVYPNPSVGTNLMLAANGFTNQEVVTLQAIDAIGRVAATATVEVGNNAQHIALPMVLKPGIYTLLMKSASGVKAQQIVIQN
jgi:hypothetical protein